MAFEASGNSLEVAVTTLAAAGKYLGPRADEYSQSKQDEDDDPELPGGKKNKGLECQRFNIFWQKKVRNFT